MRSFQFPLERILGWRRNEFEAEEARLAPLLAERKRLEAARQDLLAAWERAGKRLLAGESARGSDLVALGSYRARLQRESETNERQQKDAQERIYRQQARVREAHRHLRLLEKLRQRQLEQWRLAWDHELENFAGEAYLARWRAPGVSGKAT